MKPSEAFKFCPKCGGKFDRNKDNLLVCSNCNFRFYLNPLPCNALILENNKGEILLVKRKFDPKKGYWDLPGGFIEPGEDLDLSSKREIKEELGLDIEITKIVGVYADKYPYSGVDYSTFCVVAAAKILNGEIKYHDDIIGFQFFPKNEILNQELAFESLKTAIGDYINRN